MEIIEGFKNIHWADVLTIVIPIITAGIWAIARIDRKFDRMDARIDKQSERSDQLYQEFIHLIKEMKKTPSARS